MDFPEIGCTLNTECSHQNACINNRCVDPCAYHPCEQHQECHTDHHQPICVNLGKFLLLNLLNEQNI